MDRQRRQCLVGYIPLWLLTGWVDDRSPTLTTLARQTPATRSWSRPETATPSFSSKDVAWSNDYIIANKCNNEPLTGKSWPLRLVGDGVAKEGALTGTSVSNIAEIELTSFDTAPPIPKVRIVKYAEDQITIIDEITVDYLWMENEESGLDVIGDGTTVYRYGYTNNPDDVWDADETYPRLQGHKRREHLSKTFVTCGRHGRH